MLLASFRLVNRNLFSTTSPKSLLRHLTMASIPQQKITLRPYQKECIDSCLQELNTATRRIAVSLPTGAGKTVIFTHLIDELKPFPGQGDKTLILVHRRELAIQAAETCKRAYPDKKVDIEMGSFKASHDAEIIVASVQTLITGRLENFNPRDFKMVIVDECHHAAANSYLSILKYFGITDSGTKVALVGFSATLRREDDKILANTFDKIAFHLSLEKLIFENHLVDAKFTTVTLPEADLGKVQSARGDFVIKGLAAAVNNQENNEIILETYLHFAQTHGVKSAILFGINIEHVESLCELFKSNGIAADFVTSKTKKEQRSETIRDFKQGKVSVLMNCGIFTEGTDMPNIDCVLLARPTKSKTLLIQMIGRGLRLHASKVFCHVVDFVGINNSSVITTPTLRNLPAEFIANEQSFKEMDQEKLRLDAEAEELKRKEEAEAKEAALNELAQRDHDLREVQTQLDAMIRPGYSEKKSLEDVELTTFDSLQEFVNSKHGKETDISQLYGSKYPWVRGKTRNVWILDNSKCFARSHYRLEIHPNGLRDSFLKDVKITDIYYTPSDLLKVKTQLYTLSFYTETRKDQGMYSFYTPRWTAYLCCPISTNISDLLLYIENQNNYTKGDHTKWAPWRSTEPSKKQIDLFDKYAQRALKPEEYENVSANIGMLTKGDLSNALFAYNVFKAKGLKPALPKKVLQPKLTEPELADKLEQLQL